MTSHSNRIPIPVHSRTTRLSIPITLKTEESPYDIEADAHIRSKSSGACTQTGRECTNAGCTGEPHELTFLRALKEGCAKTSFMLSTEEAITALRQTATIMRDPPNPAATSALMEYDIEDHDTLPGIDQEAFRMNMGFFKDGALFVSPLVEMLAPVRKEENQPAA